MEQFGRTLFILLQTPFLPQPHCFGGCLYCWIACLAVPSLRLLVSVFLFSQRDRQHRQHHQISLESRSATPASGTVARWLPNLIDMHD